PNRSVAASIIAFASDSFETSACTYIACSPISAAVASPASLLTSVRTMLAPSRAKSSDATFPIPLPPPVISATFPSRGIPLSPRSLGSCVYHRLCVGFVRTFRVHVHRLLADLGGGRVPRVVVDVGQDDAGALAGEELRRDLSHPASAARDQRDLPIQSHPAHP